MAGHERESGRSGAFAASPFKTGLEALSLAASGAVFACAFPAIGWSALAWVGLIPLFWIARGKSVWKGFLLGYAWGYFWSLCAFFWLREIFFLIPFAMAAILAFFPALWAMAIPALWRNLLIPLDVRLKGSAAVKGFYGFNPLLEILFALALASWWCCLEWLRTWIFTGLPWNFLATTQWRNFSLIQICEFTGVYGVSFLAAMVNVSLAMAMDGFRRSFAEGRYKRPFPLILAVMMIMLATFGGWKALALRRAEFRSSLKVPVGVVQCDISQRRDATDAQAAEALDVCLSLSKELLKDYLSGKEDAFLKNASYAISTSDGTGGIMDAELKAMSGLSLVVWPETAVPYALRGSSSFSFNYRFQLFQLIRKCKVPFLVGSIDFGLPLADGSYEVFNAALLLNSNGEVADRYMKSHIVPFGEFVPFGDSFPKLNEWVGMGRNLTPGRRFNPIEVAPGVKAGVNICYEDVFPYISRGHALNGANLLLVITNDAWYPASYESDQHFANSVFRAVENRLPMLRCGNANYSCVVGPDGRVLDSLFKKFDPKLKAEIPAPEVKGRAAGKLMVPVPQSHRLTFYARYGNVFILACWLVFGLALALALLNWRGYKSALLASFSPRPPEVKQ